jgi:hypothetical protein
VVDPDWPRANVWLARESAQPELVVVGVPSSRASLSKSRADLAPLEMRNRLDRFSTFHGEMAVDFSDVQVLDVGNWPVSELDPVSIVEELQRMAGNLPEVTLTIYLGGDNAITRPLAAAQHDGLDRIGLITFDAHHDVRTLEDGPSNGNPIRGLIEDHGLPGQNTVQIGIHSFANSAPYRAYCDEVGITTVTVEARATRSTSMWTSMCSTWRSPRRVPEPGPGVSRSDSWPRVSLAAQPTPKSGPWTSSRSTPRWTGTTSRWTPWPTCSSPPWRASPLAESGLSPADDLFRFPGHAHRLASRKEVVGQTDRSRSVAVPPHHTVGVLREGSISVQLRHQIGQFAE